MKDLKDYREKELSLYIVANIIIFLVVHKFISINTDDTSKTVGILSQIFVASIFSVIAFSFTLVVECLFTSGFKTNLLYLFSFFGLLYMPGYTIFTHIKNNNPDNRFSYMKVMEKHPEVYANLPSDKKERMRYENENWNVIYNQYRDVSMIHFSNRDWLLCRDIYISTLVFIGYYIILTMMKLVEINWQYLVFLLILAAVTNFGTNRKAVRFAYNVIAYDVSKPQNKE